MSIWYKQVPLALLKAGGQQSMVGHIGIEITELGDDYIVGTMPVDHRTVQPFGLLHGGASVALAETLGSLGGSLTLNPEESRVVGLEINANHVKSARSGLVTGVARPIHMGRTTQLWEIKITNEANDLVCISRLTLAVIAARK